MTLESIPIRILRHYVAPTKDAHWADRYTVSREVADPNIPKDQIALYIILEDSPHYCGLLYQPELQLYSLIGKKTAEPKVPGNVTFQNHQIVLHADPFFKNGLPTPLADLYPEVHDIIKEIDA